MKFAPNSSFPGSGICNLAEEGRNFTSTFVRRLSRLLLRGNRRRRRTDLQAQRPHLTFLFQCHHNFPLRTDGPGYILPNFTQPSTKSHRHSTRKILQETILLFVLLAFPLSLVGLMRHACRTAMDDATRNEERERKNLPTAEPPN